MKKIILGMMMVIGSLTFSSEEESTVRLSNIFDNYKKEDSQNQESSQEELALGDLLKISNIFDNSEPLDENN